MSEYTVLVAARITPEMRKKLEEMAQKEYTGISTIIRRAIAHYVEKEDK